jgi:4-alpha-glucanotransferase
MALFPRSSGVLLHPTSLPGPHGIGDLGAWAYRFADWLAGHDQTIWQMLPLGPTSYGDSPYQTLSAFAGNTNLISLSRLVDDGWLAPDDLAAVPVFPADRVDFGPVIAYHNQMLARAYDRFAAGASPQQRAAFEGWCAASAGWLDDFALFAALKDHHGGRPWVEWEPELALRDPQALDEARRALAREVESHCFRQWLFFTQWADLKAYVGAKGIRLFGDIPIFVAHDSADVWANRAEYFLDERGQPTVIAGVPPDYFSPTGQRWGNPLYRWDVMRASGYRWWIERIRATLSLVDYMRIDHFRGFAGYWEIPAEEETAVRGQWVPGPGPDFLHAVRDTLGELPIIAEDLGVITADVEALRDGFHLPGMKVLQFAWSGPENPFLPHNHVPNSVVYSGTHDNNTTLGWWEQEADEETRAFIAEYLDSPLHEPNWALIRAGMRSVAHTFVAPLQDVLGLGAEARMNTPGQPSGNWTWRFTPQQFDDPAPAERLQRLTRLYQRAPDQQEKVTGDAAV